MDASLKTWLFATTRSVVIGVTFLAVAGFGAILGDALALGQLNRRPQAAASSFMPPSREVLSLLQEAEKQIQAKAWSEATLALGQLLGIEKMEGSSDSEFGVDYFLNPGSGKRVDPRFGKMVRGSLFDRVYSLVDQLPSEAIEVFNVRYGVGAKQDFSKAIQAGDWDTIERLSMQFGFLDIGEDATLLLAEQALLEGEPANAAILLQQLMGKNRALQRLGPQLGFMTAQTYLALRDRAKASEVIKRVVTQFPSHRGTWNNSEFQWSSSELSDESLASILSKLQPTSTYSMERAIVRPSIVGGDSRRNANTQSGLPLPILRWHAELHESDQSKDRLAEVLKTKVDVQGQQPVTTIPSRVPVTAGRSVICSTYDQRIVAIDLQTGLLQWACVYTGMPLGLSNDNILSRGFLDSENGAPDFLAKRVWGEAAIGNLASDGERLYGVSELPSREVSEAYALGANPRFARSMGIRTFNVLQCWSVPEEGKLLWEVGGSLSEMEPALANMYFLGPPLPHRGELLIMGELNGEISLIGIEPRSGALKWKQPLIVNESTVVVNDALRRSIGASPTAEGDLVLCPTLSGHLVTFDLHSRSLVWGLSYRQKVSNSGARAGLFGEMDAGDYSPFDNRSVELSPMIANGVAIYAPPDGFGVYALDLQSGESLWMGLESESRMVRYVGGVADNCVLVVCQNGVQGLDIKDGSDLWPMVTLENGAQVVGRGTRHGDKYYLPTSAKSIVEIDMKKGVITDTMKLESMPGNLVNIHDRIVSASPMQLDCYAIRDVFQKEITVELKSDTNSIQSLIDQGELAMAEGNTADAIEKLEMAYQKDPYNIDCWIRLRKASYQAIQSDFDKYASRVSAYNIGLENDLEFTRMLVNGLKKIGKNEDVLKRLLLLSDSRVSRRRDQVVGEDYYQASAVLSIQEDRWLDTEITNALAALPGWENEPEISMLIRAQIASIAKLPPNLQRVKLSHLRAVPETMKARVSLADEFLTEGKLQNAESLVMELLGNTPIDDWMRTNRDGALIAAKIFAASGRTDLLSRVIGKDNGGYELVTSWLKNWARDGFDPLDISKTNVADRSNENLISNWPHGVVDIEPIPSKREVDPRFAEDQIALGDVREVIGETLQGSEIGFSVVNQSIRIRRAGQEDKWLRRVDTLELGSGRDALTMFCVDSKIFMQANRTIYAIDSLPQGTLDERSEIWQKSFGSETPSVEPGRTIRIVTEEYWGIPMPDKSFQIVQAGREGILVLADENLFCLDPNTGLVLWKLLGMKGATIATGENELYALLPSNRLMTLDSRDGTLKESRVFSSTMKNAIAVKDRFLMADEPESLLRLVDAKTGETKIERKLSADTRIGLWSNKGLVTLGNDGTVNLWDFEKGQEFQHRVKLQDDKLSHRESNDEKVQRLSVQAFGDRLLILPYSSLYRYEKSGDVFPPDGESSFPVVSGSVFAISSSDGKPLWDSTVPVMQYSFPIRQNRNDSPAALFVRRINVASRGSRNVQMVNIAILDIRDGKILAEKDDMQGIHSSVFSQSVFQDEMRMQCHYGGVSMNIQWTDRPPTQSPVKIGFDDIGTYKDRIGELRRDIRVQEADSIPGFNPLP